MTKRDKVARAAARRARMGTWVVAVGAGGLVLATALTFTAPGFAPGVILANLRFPLGVLALATLPVVALCARGRWRVLVPALFLVLGLWHVAPAWRLGFGSPVGQGSAQGPELVVASANLLYGIAEPRKLGEFLGEVEPDVVGLLEVLDSGRSKVNWPKILRGWQEWPHQHIVEHHHFGMALLSKLPILRVVDHSSPDTGEPRAAQRPTHWEIWVAVEGQEVQLQLLHPARPGGSHRNRTRIEVFERVAEIGASTDGPQLVLGDLNATGYAPEFRQLLLDGGLQDSRRGFGRLGSWRHPWVPGLWVTLDHVLVGGGVEVLARGRGADIRSDHRPIWARLRLP